MSGTGPDDPSVPRTSLVRPFVGRPRPPAEAVTGPAAPERPRTAVRPYSLTGGRTRSRNSGIGFETMVVTTEEARRASELRFERREIVALCAAPLSVAELSARLRIPIGVARVLAGDLADDGLLELHTPADARFDVALLERLIDGVRAL